MAGKYGLSATIAAFMLAAVSTGAVAQERCVPTGNMPILTISGEISKPNRGPFDKNNDKLLGYAEKDFRQARTFTADELVALGMVEIEAYSPYGKQKHRLAGPLLSSVLEAAGAKPDAALDILALDRFEPEMSAAELKRLRPILALCKEGKPLGLGNLGPVYVSFETPQPPTDAEETMMVWGAVHILVK